MTNSILSILQLSDPTLPIGSFSHSNALETYVQKGIVYDINTTNHFVEQMLRQNLFYTDAAIMSLAFDYFQEKKMDDILAIDALCSACKLPKESRVSSIKLGNRLLKLMAPLANNELLESLNIQKINKKFDGNYCTIFGCIASALGIEKNQAIEAFYYNAAVGYITNAVKLVPLSQQSGQHLLFNLLPTIHQLSISTLQPNKQLIGYCCTAFDIRSMQHERLYSRLYMS